MSTPKKPVYLCIYCGGAEHEQADNRCRLLGLPAELRNKIYELALPAQHLYGKLAPREFIHRRWKPPGLLSTNRQIRAEMDSIYYRGKDFRIDYLLAARWLTTFQPTWMKYDGGLIVDLREYCKADSIHRSRRMYEEFRACVDPLKREAVGGSVFRSKAEL